MPEVHARRPTLPEYDEWIRTLVRNYAADHVAAGNWTEEESVGKARAETTGLLPNGLDTPGHFLYILEDASNGAVVAHVWFRAERGAAEHGRPEVFVFDLLVDPTFRGQGYGAAAMRFVEARARELGFDTVSLHVFGRNDTAIALYRKLGYAATNLRMSKRLGAGPE